MRPITKFALALAMGYTALVMGVLLWTTWTIDLQLLEERVGAFMLTMLFSFGVGAGLWIWFITEKDKDS